MSRTSRARRCVGWAACAAIAVTWTVFLRPPALGGSTAYVFVRGTSMEPTYHTGDLVLVRRRGTYRTGDVAAFAVPGRDGRQLVVIHRIVGVNPDGTHVLLGDNRSEPDPWHPTHGQIVGAPILLVPAAGRWLGELAARPLLLGAGCAALAALLVLLPAREPARRARGKPIPPILLELVAAHGPPGGGTGRRQVPVVDTAAARSGATMPSSKLRTALSAS